MAGLPLCATVPGLRVGGVPVVLSHSCAHRHWENLGTPSGEAGVLYGRDFPVCAEDVRPFYNVFGHTVMESPLLRAWGAGIDLGCVYGGSLCAFNPSSGEILSEGRSGKDVE